MQIFNWIWYYIEKNIYEDKLRALPIPDFLAVLLEFIDDEFDIVNNIARERNLLNSDNSINASIETQKQAKKILNIYSKIASSHTVPINWVSYDTNYILSSASTSELDGEILDSDEVLLKKYEEVLSSVKLDYSLYESMSYMYNLDDPQFISIANKFNKTHSVTNNSDYDDELTKRTPQEVAQDYMINYFRKRILSIKPAYLSYLIAYPNGVLSDTINLAAEQIQSDILKNNNTPTTPTDTDQDDGSNHEL